ncbi:MAG TPA: hypothetical protein VJK02_17375 [Anaerolineales bacterium]|nr:hypothetical protein [Anaerolineales bacterium]
MATGKDLTKMNEGELAELRIALDEKLQQIRQQKGDIQRELDRRAAQQPRSDADHTIGVGA